MEYNRSRLGGSADTWALACLSWRIWVRCLDRCFAFSWSIPPSWTWCWLSSFWAGWSGVTSGRRTEKHTVFVKSVPLVVFVSKDFGGTGEWSFPLLLLFPLHHNRFQMVLDKNWDSEHQEKSVSLCKRHFPGSEKDPLVDDSYMFFKVDYSVLWSNASSTQRSSVLCRMFDNGEVEQEIV